MNSKTKKDSTIKAAMITGLAIIVAGIIGIIPFIIKSNGKQTSNEYKLSESDTSAISIPSEEIRNKKEGVNIQPHEHRQKAVSQFARKSISSSSKILILIQQSSEYSVRSSLAQEIVSHELFKNGFDPISESDIGRANAQLIRNAVQKARLTSLHQHYSNTFDIIILGEISVQPLSDIQGMKIFIADVFAKAVSLNKGRSLGVQSFQGVRGFGLTEEQAAEDAISKAALKAAEGIIDDILSFIKE